MGAHAAHDARPHHEHRLQPGGGGPGAGEPDRFSLFFPEKRDFFLENEGTFAFQDVHDPQLPDRIEPQHFKLFHSRRIGLSPDRTPLPIAGGARLTGKLSERTEVGFLEMQTRSRRLRRTPPDCSRPRTSPSRACARFWAARPTLGVMFVNRQQTAGAGDRALQPLVRRRRQRHALRRPDPVGVRGPHGRASPHGRQP